MYIPESWAGVMVTVFVEVVAIIVVAFIMGKKK